MMYRLLIADDEALEREGLELMISRMLPGQFHFIHAENGRKAIQLAEEERPDFIFMDIKMPGIQGLEAIREIAGRYPEIRIVLVTAHDYFAYAKEALSLGVKEYLLKPAKREELLHVLNRLTAELEEEKRKRAAELELREQLSELLPLVESELAIMLMMDCVQEMDLLHLTELLHLRWEKGYALVLSFSCQMKKDWEQFQAVKKNLYEALKLFIKPQLACIISPMIGNQLTLFIPASRNSPGYTQRVEALEWGERLRGFVESKFALSASVGIGSVQEGMEGLRRSYHEAAIVAADASAFVSVRHYEDIGEGSGTTFITLDEEKKLLDALRMQRREEAFSLFNLLFERLAAAGGGELERCRNEIAALFISLSRQLTAGAPTDIISRFAAADRLEHLRQASYAQLDRLLEGMKAERERRQSYVLDRAKAYIAQNYKEDISMERTAEHVNLSPYYFSKMFKLHAGETFIDYVTRLRIDQAKRLLEDETLSLKEICYEVGYKDPNYFSRVFKKVTGVTPTEYRQQSGAQSPC